jgi:hypothetical protein
VATTLHIDTKLRVMTFEMRDALETLGIYGDDDVPTCMFCKREIAATMFGDHGDAPLDTVFQTDGTNIWCAECASKSAWERVAKLKQEVVFAQAMADSVIRDVKRLTGMTLE